MANRAEVLDKLKTAASEGKIREAYREFEELPIVDQIAISLSPGVGDALAVYEIGEFGARGAKNIEERDFLGALGNYGLSGLSAISILPLFRLFRTAKTAKTVVKTPDVPEAKVKVDKKEFKEEPKKDLPVPKVEEFKPLDLKDLQYPGLQSTYGATGLTSKAAKFVNYNKNLPNQGKAVAFINALEKGGVPKGELRLLNIIDETGDIHPKLLSELEIRNPQGRITRQRLAEYIYSNQRGGALQQKIVAENDLVARNRLKNSNISNPINEEEATYHIRGLERQGAGTHYSNSPTIHNPHYVFDAKVDNTIPDVIAGTSLKGFKEGDKILNLGRIQSDYSSELADAVKINKRKQLQAIKDNPKYRNWDKNLQDRGIEIDIRDEMVKAVRQMPNSTPKKMKESFLKSLKARGVDEEQLPVGVGKLEDFVLLTPIVKAAQEQFPISPFIDGAKLKAGRQALDEYNKIVPKVNKLVKEKIKLREEADALKKSGLTDDSPSISGRRKEINDRSAAINKEVADLVPSEATDLFKGFTLSKGDLEAATGKPFTESLGKSLDDIFYDIEELGGGAIRQKYGPGTPGERALNYFNELVNDDSLTFSIGDGLSILKKATKLNKSLYPGVAIDPYAKSTSTEIAKLPVRSRFLEAIHNDYDGFSVDSAAKRLGDEGGSDNIYLQNLYDKNAPNEIEKILKELGADPKKYISKLEDTENLPGDTARAFSGTYVKIDDELRKLVEEKGVDAFKDGGPVKNGGDSNIQKLLDDINKNLGIDEVELDVGSIKPIKELEFPKPVGSEGLEAVIYGFVNPAKKLRLAKKGRPLVGTVSGLLKSDPAYIRDLKLRAGTVRRTLDNKISRLNQKEKMRSYGIDPDRDTPDFNKTANIKNSVDRLNAEIEDLSAALVRYAKLQSNKRNNLPDPLLDLTTDGQKRFIINLANKNSKDYR